MIEKIKYYVRNMTRTPDITRQDQEVANLVRSDIYTDYATHVAAYRIAIEKAYSGELATLKAQRDELLAAAKAVIACHDEDIDMDEFGDDESVGSEMDSTGAIADMPMTFGMLRRLRAAIANAERPAGC